jgi:AIPR protein
MAKFIQTEPEGKLAAKITDHTNNQNGTTARDLQSNNLIQTRLQTEINGKGDFCYRIKRGEHAEWSDDKVIENQLAARVLLAFDVKQPWSCHQTYKLFEELYSPIFSRLEVAGDRVVTLYRLYQILLTKLDLIDNQLFARYRLTEFFLMYLLRQALETDKLGKQFCTNPAPFISTHNDQAHLLSCMDNIAHAIVRVVNGEVQRRDADAARAFDFKRDLKNPHKVRELEAPIITTYQVLIDNDAAPTFERVWKMRSSSKAGA